MDLITQGTSLHRSPGVSSNMLSDEELAPSIKESPWYHRKMSFLGKKRHQHWGKLSSEDMQPISMVSSSDVEKQFFFTKNVPPSTNWQSGSFHEKLPAKQVGPYSAPESLSAIKERSPLPRESQLPFSESWLLPLGQSSLESQPASQKEKTTFWKVLLLSQKSWPYIWQREPQLHSEGMVPFPSETHPPVVETATE